MLDFQLFRLKAVRTTGSLFSTEESPASLIREAVFSQPERRSWRGHVWHIGNVEPIDDDSLYFAFGRTTRTNLPFFNSVARSFSESEFESAPFTHVIVDTRLGLCAIARKTQLASNTEKVARQLQRILNDTETAYNKFVTFLVEPLSDPAQFIEQIRGASAVVAFMVTFSRPNPFDAQEDFQKPMERYLDAVDGGVGRTTVKGDNLNREVLEEMTRSAAATGNDASARLVREGDGRPVTKKLHQNIVTLPVSEIVIVDDRRQVVAWIREVYERIRYNRRDQ